MLHYLINKLIHLLISLDLQKKCYFDHIVTSEETGADKPNESMFKLSLEKMKPEGTCFWMIGDNPISDIKGSRESIGAITFQKIHDDLNENWIVIAEAIQTILRREGYKNPYEKIKELTRNNKKITKNDLLVFINRLDVSKQIKDELKNISPKNYTGI